jgi:hypothetical protein
MAEVTRHVKRCVSASSGGQKVHAAVLNEKIEALVVPFLRSDENAAFELELVLALLVLMMMLVLLVQDLPKFSVVALVARGGSAVGGSAVRAGANGFLFSADSLFRRRRRKLGV